MARNGWYMASGLPDPEKMRLDSEQNRLEFLKTDLDLSFTFLDLAQTELQMGDTEQAERVLAKAEDAHATISRLSLRVSEGEKKAGVEARLRELSDRVDTVRLDIEKHKAKATGLLFGKI